MKYLVFTFWIMVVCSVQLSAQNQTASLTIVEGERNVYSVGDSLTILASAVLPSTMCEHGMEKCRIFLSGLKMFKEEGWAKKDNNVWTNRYKICILNNSKSESKITVMRKSEGGEFFAQLKLNVDNGNVSK